MELQSIATQSLREGLEEYDRRHGFRKPENLNDLFPKGFSEMSFLEQLNYIAIELEIDSELNYDDPSLERVSNFLEES